MSRVSTPSRQPQPGPSTAVANLPPGFVHLGQAPIGAVAGDAVTDAYLWFSSTKSKQWAEMKAKLPALVEGDPVYVSKDNTEIVRVLKFHLVAADQFWARKDGATGQPAGGVTFDDPGGRASGKEEYINAVILLQTSKGLLPCRVGLKSGLLGAINPALKELDAVTNDLAAWASRSPAHDLAAKANVAMPGFRFITVASFQFKTAKASGMPYLNGRGTCQPISVDDVALFKGLPAEPVSRLCELVASEHAKRMDLIRKLPA